MSIDYAIHCGDPYADRERFWDLTWSEVFQTQATLAASAAEVETIAMIRRGWRPVAAAGEWDDLADDLEVLVLHDWDPVRSIRVCLPPPKHTKVCTPAPRVKHPFCRWCARRHERRYLCDPALRYLERSMS